MSVRWTLAALLLTVQAGALRLPARLQSLQGKPPGHLVLVRHGKTEWDASSTFAGWADPDINREGALQTKEIARAITESGYSFDVAFTSVLKRAVHTTWLLLRELNLVHLPIWKTWKLNERSYGTLTGRSIDEMVALHGGQEVASWRRSLTKRPPPIYPDHPFHPARGSISGERKYLRWQDRDGAIKPVAPPACESLGDTIKRVLPVWREEILPELCDGKARPPRNRRVTARALPTGGRVPLPPQPQPRALSFAPPSAAEWAGGELAGLREGGERAGARARGVGSGGR